MIIAHNHNEIMPGPLFGHAIDDVPINSSPCYVLLLLMIINCSCARKLHNVMMPDPFFSHAIVVVSINSSRSYTLLLLMIIIVVSKSYILFKFTFHCAIKL